MAASIRARREALGWSQQALAQRAGITRQQLGAMEGGRHVPSVTAALAVARALDVSVEELFGPAPSGPVPVLGAPLPPGTPVAVGRVGDTVVTAPLANAVVDAEQWAIPDAITTGDGLEWLPGRAGDSLVVAGCDPLIGTLAGLVERSGSHRLVTVHATTGESISALGAGRVHAAIVHGPADRLPAPPVEVRGWRVGSWQAGLAARARTPPSVDELAARRTTVVQRDPDAGTQQALQRALADHGVDRLRGPTAGGHIDVARRVAAGGGHAGVTMGAAAIAFGLSFTPLEDHDVELWLDARWAQLPQAVALLDVLTSAAFQHRAQRIGGYDLHGSGSERRAADPPSAPAEGGAHRRAHR